MMVLESCKGLQWHRACKALHLKCWH